MAQTVKNLPAIQETWVQSLDLKIPWRKGMATHSSVPTWRITSVLMFLFFHLNTFKKYNKAQRIQQARMFLLLRISNIFNILFLGFYLLFYL